MRMRILMFAMFASQDFAPRDLQEARTKEKNVSSSRRDFLAYHR